MTDVAIDKDLDQHALTVTCEFAAPVARVWQLWADPRQLERWWGPPGYPATVEAHELVPGGDVRYYMTGPEGERYGGYWRIVSVDPPTTLEFEDGFADSAGVPNDEMPVGTVTVELAEREGVTEMKVRTVYGSREHLDKVLEMGMAEGMTAAIGQIESILAE